MRRVAAILVAFVLGCASVPQLQRVERPEPVNEKWLILAPDLAQHVPEWHRRFVEALGTGDIFIVAAHGADYENDWWFGIGDAEHARPSGKWSMMAGFLRLKLKPSTKLIILSCNEGGHILGIPNVYQPMQTLWAKPGEDVRRLPDGSTRWLAGDVDDFVVVR
jgi:hypothetical protein